MKLTWYKFAGCAAAIAAAASASVATAAEQLPITGVVVSDPIATISYDECCPQHTDYLACPPNPCEPQGTVVPNMGVPNMGVPQMNAPQIGMPAPVVIPEITPEATQAPVESAMAPTPSDNMADEPASSSNAFADALVAPVAEPAPLDFASFSQPSGGVGFGSASAVASAPAPGYIDYAPVRTRFRLRYDNAQGSNDPTRAEFLYPSPSAGLGPNANGPTLLGAGNGDVQLEELSFYFEFALFERLSVFIDTPIRAVSNVDFTGDGSPDTQDGFGDLRTGFKLGLIADEDTFLTTQLVVSTPTGDGRRALGTGNVSLDIGLLYQQQVSDKVYLYGEFRDWFTLDAPTVAANTGPVDLNSNVLRFGGGIGVDVLDFGSCCHKPKKLTALFEVVGWTVLDGFSTDINGSNIVTDAQGDTIINGKYGLRYTDGDHTAYVGYGHNWSSDRWYSDLVRFQYGYFF